MKDNVAHSGRKMIITVSYMTIGMLGAYLSIYQYTILGISQLFLLNAAMLGLMIGMQHVGISIPPLFMGPLCLKIGKKRLILISYALIILGTFLAGMTGSFIGFIVCVFIIGAGYSVTEATLSAVLSDEFPGDSTRHLNFSQVAFSVGAMAGPFIAQGLIESGVYFKDLYFYVSAVFLVLAVLFLFTRHQNDMGGQPAEKGAFFAIRFLRSRVFLLLALSIFLYVGIENTVSSFTDSYFEIDLGEPAMSATALSLFWGAMIPSRFLAGVLKTDRKKMFIFLAALVASASVAAMLVPDYTAKIILFAVCGFGCGPMWPLLMDSVAKRTKGSAGPAMNMMMSFSGFGGAALPVLAGLAVFGLGSESAAYYLSAAVAGAMLVLYLLSTREDRRRGEDA